MKNSFEDPTFFNDFEEENDNLDEENESFSFLNNNEDDDIPEIPDLDE